MRNRWTAACLFTLISLAAGCASVTKFSYRVTYPEPVNVDDIVGATVSVLQDSGYNVAVLNEKLGLVTTEWKSLTSGGSQAAQMIFLGSADTRRIKLSINVLKPSKMIKISPTVERQTSSFYGAQAPAEVTMNEAEKAAVRKLGERILASLNLDPSKLEIYQEDQSMQ